MRNLSVKQVQAMVGTEFDYVLSSGAVIKALVAKFDPKIGFTCVAIDCVDSAGTDLSRYTKKGILCLIGIRAIHHNTRKDMMNRISDKVRRIKTGVYKGGISLGAPSCGF